MPPQNGLGVYNGRGAAPGGQHRGCEQEAKSVKRREPRMRRLPAQDHHLLPEHRILDDEFPSAAANVGRHSPHDAWPAVGGDRFPDGSGSRPDTVDDVTPEVHLHFDHVWVADQRGALTKFLCRFTGMTMVGITGLLPRLLGGGEGETSAETLPNLGQNFQLQVPFLAI